MFVHSSAEPSHQNGMTRELSGVCLVVYVKIDEYILGLCSNRSLYSLATETCQREHETEANQAPQY